MEVEIAEYQKKILEQKSRMGGINAAQVNNQLVQKQIKQLENRMDKNLRVYNEILADNRELRQKIDDYRRERVVFDQIYKKLERELHEKKKEMTAIIEDSKNSYLLREKSQIELLKLQETAETEKEKFEKEFAELGKMIKEQQHMLQQIRLKELDAAQDKLKRMGVGSPKSNSLTSNDHVDAFEKNNSNQTNMLNLNNTNTSNSNFQQNIDKTVSYEKAIDEIRRSTGIYDIQENINKFLEAEAQNFSLFTYVNNINSEITRLEHSNAEMRNQIEKYRGQGMSSDTQRKRDLRILEEKLSKIEKKSNDFDHRYHLAKRVLSQLKNGIQSIYTRIGAAATSSNVPISTNNTHTEANRKNSTFTLASTSTSGTNATSNHTTVHKNSAVAYDELLGSQGVTESNMLQYLGFIEQRTAEILQAYAEAQNNMPGSTTKFALKEPTPIPSDGPMKLQLEIPPPSCNDFSSSDDSDGDEGERPLTRIELEKKFSKSKEAVKNRKSGILAN